MMTQLVPPAPDKLLPCSFYQQPVTDVARNLLGKLLVRSHDGLRASGTIIEAEAYRGEEDLACHAKAGYTRRTAVMYGKAGTSYVYFTYGMHWMLNIVCEDTGFPAAVLIRAIVVVEGSDWVSDNRPSVSPKHWCDGPAKLTRALQIDGTHNGLDLCIQPDQLWVEEGIKIDDSQVNQTPRIGLGNVPEPWLSIPWRFHTSILNTLIPR